MSTLSTRRSTRSGAGGPRTGSIQKPTTPISISDRNPNSALKKSFSGKENLGSNTRSLKPTIRSLPRVDKAAVAAGSGDVGDSRIRWSTSSVPRGRSQSPSEFIRVFRDNKVSKGEGDNRAVPSAVKRSENRKFRDSTDGELEKLMGNDSKVGDFKSDSSRVRVKEVSLSSSVMKSSEVDGARNSKNAKFEYLRVEKSDSSRESSQKSYGKSKVLENLKEKGMNNNAVGSDIGIKYPSKLHEKLVFLEGKVKRIASDIKRTKEMLDANNPDASKMILSDIQDKISGIEKAMGNVVGGDSSKNNVNDVGQNKVAEIGETKEVDNFKSSVKGLNNEELEARLLPHHKLLRNRISLKASSAMSGHSQSDDEPNVVESKADSKVEEKLLSPIEENPIALEFLASLNKKNPKVTLRDAKADLESSKVQDSGGATASESQESSKAFDCEEELVLTTEETLDEFDDQENTHEIVMDEGTEETCVYEVKEIGRKTSTGGWFVSEGESIILAHDDGSCSFYDIANCEEKAVYKPPVDVSPDIWRDCWIVRAPSADGCSGRYVVAASAGNTLDSGFCSWDFYSKDVRAFHIEDGGSTATRTVLGPLSNNTSHRRNGLSSALVPESQQWWYKPCGPLIISTASSQRVVKVFDIRDGEQVMKWEVHKPVFSMEHSSPLQWRNRGKVVIAEAETISVWDVNSLNPQSIMSVSTSGRKISALHVINTDAELGGGVRQRVTSAEAEGNDGVFCTPDSINVLDFRHPSGIGLKIPKVGFSAQSVFTRGDAVYMGCTNMRSLGKKQTCSQLQHFSLRKQRLVSSYSLPETSTHSHYSAITQVWGNSNLVMGVCGLGLFVFDALKDDDALESCTIDSGATQKVKDVIGPDDLYSPSFDYLASRVLLISGDRPALWRHLL